MNKIYEQIVFEGNLYDAMSKRVLDSLKSEKSSTFVLSERNQGGNLSKEIFHHKD